MREMETFSAEAPPLVVSKDEIEIEILMLLTDARNTPTENATDTKMQLQ